MGDSRSYMGYIPGFTVHMNINNLIDGVYSSHRKNKAFTDRPTRKTPHLK